MARPSEDAEAAPHTPVLYKNVLSALRLCAGSHYVDGTVGAGGHAAGILEAISPDGELLGLDRDPDALKVAEDTLAKFGHRIHLRHGSFKDLEDHCQAIGWNHVAGVLFDLGLSSMQLADAQRGFSFQRDGPLDMRFDLSQSKTAEELVNHLSWQELADLIFQNGQESRARKIARAIVESRPLRSTRQLADLVANVYGYRRGRIHPATKTFQALRIAVNDELETLSKGLAAALQILSQGGRLVVISFHSLEDRVVKRFFRTEAKACICPPEQPVCSCDHKPQLEVLTKRPIFPSEAEVEANPRARSARMRVAKKIGLA
jgi:16S rRNA (cytosine1402-N4)-methyltransferase